MASSRSVAKRARQNEERRVRNRQVKSRVKTAIKRFRAALAEGNRDEAAARLRLAERLLRKAGSRGVLPRGRVDRTVSRLAKNLARSERPSS